MLNAQKTILIVEDERIVAKDLKRSLIELGYRVPNTAGSADDALRFATEHCPDLVLMDVRIEGERDGIDAAEVFRTRFGVPVVYLTAFADEQTVARAKRTEPYGYLLKPVRPEELRSAVEVALHKHGMERQRLEQDRRVAVTLRSIGDAVLSTDRESRIAFMNPVAESLTGWCSADAIGHALDEVLPLRDLQTHAPILDPIARALGVGRTVEVAGALVAKDGEVRMIVNSASPIVDERGVVMGGVLVFRELRDQTRPVNDWLALQKSAAGLAHEINSPLTFVMANIQFALAELRAHEQQLAGQSWVEEVDRALAEAQGGADRVRRIVNDDHESTGDAERADLQRVVEGSLKLAQHELNGRARIVIALEPTPLVRGDETRLGQVVSNLLSNAANALPEGRPDENEIRISTALVGAEHVVLEVRDNGRGMSEDVKKRVFQPFFTTKRELRGHGFGLSICHGIVAALGGGISVESTPGRGSSFRVLLPVERGGLVRSQRAPGHILIVDDEPMINESLRRILAPLHRVALAQDGAHALQLFAAGERFDLVICDLMMDELTGMDLHAELMRSDPDQARRMLFMTGGAFTARSIEFLKTVENPCMQKPLSPVELENTIAKLLASFGPIRTLKAS